MITLIQLADIHFGSEDPTALGIAAKLIHDVKPDGLIVCGDLTQRGKRTEFQAAADWLSQFTAPQIVTPGNHDTPLLDISARVSRPFSRFRTYFGALEDPLILDGVHCTGVNTARGWQARSNWAEGSIDLGELSTIIDFAGAEKIGVSLLTCHHPFLSPPGAAMKTKTRRGKRASEMLANSPTDVLLTGHVHTPSSHIWNHGAGSYLAVSCGTLSTRTRAAPPSLNILYIEDQSVQIDVASIEDGDVVISRLHAYDFAHTKQ